MITGMTPILQTPTRPENKVTDCYVGLHPVSSKYVDSIALNVSVPRPCPILQKLFPLLGPARGALS